MLRSKVSDILLKEKHDTKKVVNREVNHLFHLSHHQYKADGETDGAKVAVLAALIIFRYRVQLGH